MNSLIPMSEASILIEQKWATPVQPAGKNRQRLIVGEK
jgi:hypothetical protein